MGVDSVVRAARGRAGEDVACAHLQGQGMTIVERNFRCRGGEIDIVAREGTTTVFVEVRLRSRASHGTGVETVTGTKRKRIILAARVYAAGRDLGDSLLRFDVISVDGGDGRWSVRHDRDAFDECGR